MTTVLPAFKQLYRIPYLQFYCLVAHRNHFGPEFDPDGDLVLLAETVIDELQQQTALAHPYIVGLLPVSPIMMNLNI